MCGILGIVSLNERPVSLTEPQVVAMRDQLTHRGPDDAGLLTISPHAIFAHRRLSIRDPGHGQQPWSSEDGRWTITYNGELYNTDELEAATTDRWGPPKTRCDTELLLRTVADEWQNAPDRLRGMFAFAAYDRNDRRLLLARDRFGVKPLYYGIFGHELLFASSPAPLLQHPQYSRRVNSRALIHYLMTLRLHLGTETLYEGIYSLPPGHRLQVSSQGLQLDRYWEYPVVCPSGSFAEATNRLDQQLAEATTRRLVSDVPVGMMLSGGVDSCLLGSYVRDGLETQFVAECGAGLDVGPGSEAYFAQASAEWLGCRFAAIETNSQEYLTSWRQLVSRYGLPLATPSDVIIFRLATSLKQQVGVVLGGEGADELFGGYALIHGLGWEHDLRFRGQSVDSLILKYFRQASLIPVEGLRLLLPGERVDDHMDAIVSQYQKIARQSQLPEQPGMSAIKGLLHRLNLESLLLRLDAATMAASLEARVPFTDHRLVESFWTMPTDWMLASTESNSGQNISALEQSGKLESKRLLRTLAGHRIPTKIAGRRKQSFPTAVPNWLAGDWRKTTETELTESAFLRTRFDNAVLGQLAAAPEQSGMWLWPLLNLALWSEQQGMT